MEPIVLVGAIIVIFGLWQEVRPGNATDRQLQFLIVASC